MGLLTEQTVKKLNFQNPSWRTAAILKTVKSPYLRNRFTDFDEIWYVDTDWLLTHRWNFEFFKNQDGNGRRIEKSQKSRKNLRNGFTDLYKIWYFSAK